MNFSNEQKKSLKSLIWALGAVILLVGALTELYSTSTGLIIALIIWILMSPVLKLLGLEAKKEEPPVVNEQGQAVEKPKKKWFNSLGQIILIIILVAVLVSFGLSYAFGRGSGNVIEETREVAGFNQVSLSGQGNLYLTQGETEGLRIEAEDNIVKKIKTSVNGNKLEIKYKTVWFFWDLWAREEINFYLAVKDLNNISLSGSGKIFTEDFAGEDLEINISGSGEAEMKVDLNSITTNISGSGKFTLTGTAEEQLIDISGSGTFLNRDLKTRKTEIKISGSGKAELYAEEELKIDISGSGTVKYLGSPKVSQSISGSGTIEQLKASEEEAAAGEEE